MSNLQLTSNQKEDYDLVFSGFYKKSLEERLQQIKSQFKNMDVQNFQTGGLSLSNAQFMIENCIGKISLPLGLGLFFLINDKKYSIPMAIEEPSVIAASSAAAKFIAENNGFQTQSTRQIMIGQIQMLDSDVQVGQFKIQQKKKDIIKYANTKCESMIQRGGGVVDIQTKILNLNSNIDLCVGEKLQPMLIIEIFMDVCDSMGANIINTICEQISPYLEQLLQARTGLRILSNLCTERKALASFQIPIQKMEYKGHSGEEVAYKILEAYRFAQMDPYRASTHNKGIMNGIDAVAIATGQDWRAIESAAHAFAVKNHKYQPLTRYRIVEKNSQKYFQGDLELPISVGVQGGVQSSNLIYQNNLQLLNYPSSAELSEMMCCVGLAQNFAALRALVIQGIQQGHMALHSKNIAIAAGVPTHLVEDAAKYMRMTGGINKESARSYMNAHDIFSTLRQQQQQEKTQLSTFYVEFKPKSFDEKIVLHVAFNCFSNDQIHLSIQKDKPKARQIFNDIHCKLFGNKEFEWLTNIFDTLDILKAFQKQTLKQTYTVYQLKLLSILINLLVFSLVKIDYQKTNFIFKNIQQEINTGQLFDTKEIIINEPIHLKYGLSLFCELFRVFKYITQKIQNQKLRNQLINEMYLVIEGEIGCANFWQAAKENKFCFQDYLNARKKRLCVTLMFLCDCILYSPENQLQLEILNLLGDYYELKGTIIHDIIKWEKNTDYNLYTYWLLMNNFFIKGKDQDIQDMFLKQIEEILQKKMIIIQSKQTNSDQFSSEKNDKLLREYYNFQGLNQFMIKSKL